MKHGIIIIYKKFLSGNISSLELMGDVNAIPLFFGRNSSLGLRTHKRWDRSRPLGSAVVEYQALSARSDSNFAGDRPRKQALETPGYTRITTGPHFLSGEAKVDVRTVLCSTTLSRSKN